MIPFNYHHLYYFFTVAEAGSITQASKMLRLAQPTLSAQLKQFEHYLDRRLFEREGRRLVLTEDGHHVLSYAKAIFDLGKQLSDSLGDRPKAGHLRIQIGISSFVPHSLAHSVLSFLAKIHPDLYISAVEKSVPEMIEDLRVHKLDMILSDAPHHGDASEGFQNHLFAKIPLVLCASKPLARKCRKIPGDLNNAPMILPTPQSRTYHQLQEYFLRHGIAPKIVAEIQDLELTRRLALSSKGIAPLNIHTATAAPANEKLVILGRARNFDIHDTIYLIRKDRKSPHPLVTLLLEKFRLD